jgi:hypothetical protein
MGAAEFGVGDRVRLIGTDTIQTVRQYNAETLEYQVQRGNEEDTVVWGTGNLPRTCRTKPKRPQSGPLCHPMK